MNLSSRLILLALAFIAGVLAEPPFDMQHFKTEPKLQIPRVTVLNITQNRSLLQPGFVFLDSIFKNMPMPRGGTGPMIFDMDGHLVWGGIDVVDAEAFRTQHTHVCDYRGALGTHLCTTETYFHNSTRKDGHRRVDQYGAHKILNQQYEQVIPNLASASGFSTPQYPDQHEFALVDNGKSFLQVIYHPTRMNFTSIGGQLDQEILEGCFQDVDLETGEVIFHWCGLGNLKLSDSSGSTAKFVLERPPDAKPWDWMHINSLDKNEEGDYLISIRYFSQVIKIAGANAMNVHGVQPGTMLWRLGGKAGNIKASEDISFAWQHDARFYSTKKSETIITMFDNFKVTNMKERECSGKMIKINNETMEAELLQQWKHPEGLLCDSMGSVRIQPNGNAFIGWGNQALFSEFSAKGELLYHASFAAHGASPMRTYNYRTIKSTWQSTPKTKPKLLAYAKTCRRHSSPLVAYVSWNGATEVAMWRFSVSPVGRSGPWINAGVFAREGFETRAILLPQLPSILTGHSKYVSVEALDKNSKVLASTISNLYVPNPNTTESTPHCDEYGCYTPENYGYEDAENFVGECGGAPVWSICWVALLALGFVALGASFLVRFIQQRRRSRTVCIKREYTDDLEPLISKESA